MGTIATLGITAGTAHASVVAAATVNIPQELVSGTIKTISNSTNPITYTPTAALSGTVIVNVSGGSFGSGTYYLVSGTNSSCSFAVGSYTSTLSLNSCTLSANTNYVLSSASNSPAALSFTNVSNASLVVSMSSAAGSGSVTLFNATPELSFATPSSSVYTIATNQTSFSNNNSNMAGNSISMTDNYNNTSWLNNGSITSGNINFVFSNIPSSVTSVSASVSNTSTINFASSSTTSTTNIANNSATINASITVTSPSSSVGSNTFSFTFSNSGNIATGTIDVAVNGSSLSGGSAISTSSGGSYTWLNSTPFVTFTNLTTSIYGELVYLTPAAMQTFYEELRLVLPSGVSASNVSISLAGNSCGSLSQYMSSSVSSGTNGTTTYNLNMSELFSCISSISYNVGDLVPIQITLPANTNISQVSGVAFIAGAGQSKRLPLNVVQGQASHLTY